MKHYLKYEQTIDASIDEVWNFFSDAKNLTVLTPKDMKMKVITQLPDTRLFDGMRIEYSVAPLFGFPMYWQTDIINVKEKKQFIDIQKKGPFKSWKHTHIFNEIENGVQMIDEVEYEMPLGSFGDLFHRPLVLKKLKELFKYRHQICDQIFNKKGDIFLD